MSTITATTPRDLAAQRAAALERANEIRQKRKVMKEALRAMSREEGRGRAADLLDPPAVDWLYSMLVLDFLNAVPGIGAAHSVPALRRRGIGQGRRIGQLTAAQAEDLAAAIRAAGWGIR